MKQTRRTFLQTASLLTAGLPLANLKLLGDESAPKAAEPRKQQTKIETFPLVKAAEAYERMTSGKARFRVVLTM